MQINIAFIALLTAVAATPIAGTVGLEKRQTYNGIASYYTQQGVAGSCGQYHSDRDYICALSPYWQSGGASCGRQIRITNVGGGQNNNGYGNSVTVTVADTCPGCDSTHIDLAEGPFEALTGGNLDPPGVFNIQWEFV